MSSKRKIQCRSGIASVQASSSNFILSVTDLNGNLLAWTSGGKTQKGSRKSAPYAARESSRKLAEEVCQSIGMHEVIVKVKGVYPAKDGAIQGLSDGGLKVLRIIDRTPDQHGGCRRKKEKRN
jgi:small subunit ribosomal protein S11